MYESAKPALRFARVTRIFSRAASVYGMLPVGRIDDQRRPLVAGQLDPALVPELVVRQDAALSPRRVAGARRTRDRVEQIPIEPRVLRRLELRGLLAPTASPCPRTGLGALHRRDGAEREDSLQVRDALRRPRRRPAAARLGFDLRDDDAGNEADERKRDQQRSVVSTVHVRSSQSISRQNAIVPYDAGRKQVAPAGARGEQPAVKPPRRTESRS